MPTSVDGRVYRCSFTVPMQTGGMLELLEIEQTARDLTWTKTCLDPADRLSRGCRRITSSVWRPSRPRRGPVPMRWI